jgi:hypothetical protein
MDAQLCDENYGICNFSCGLLSFYSLGPPAC